jgi:hypothetical protein
MLTKKMGERQRFTVSALPRKFTQISRNVLYEIITVGLSQVLCKTGSENSHVCAQNAENGFDFDFQSNATKTTMKFSISQ